MLLKLEEAWQAVRFEDQTTWPKVWAQPESRFEITQGQRIPELQASFERDVEGERQDLRAA